MSSMLIYLFSALGREHLHLYKVLVIKTHDIFAYETASLHIIIVVESGERSLDACSQP